MPPLKNREPEYTIADACLQGRIKEEGNQVELGKPLNGSPLLLAMSPTNAWASVILEDEDYGSKGSVDAIVGRRRAPRTVRLD